MGRCVFPSLGIEIGNFRWTLFALFATAGLLGPANAEGIHPTVADCVALYQGLVHTDMRRGGPHLYLLANPGKLRDLESISELRIGQYNVERLRNYRLEPGARSERRLEQLRAAVDRADNDIMIWEEVQDVQAAKDFVDSKLGGRYRVLMVEGNDSYGVNIAVLVKKDLPFDIELQSHRNIAFQPRRGERPHRTFTRDLPVVTFRKAGSTEKDKPLFRIAGAHFISQQGASPNPNLHWIREREALAAAQILSGFEQSEPSVPIFLLGDFNVDVRNAREMRPLWKMGFRDAFDLARKPLAKESRSTYVYFSNNGTPVRNQLDAQLANRIAADAGIVTHAEILPNRYPDGSERFLPRTFEERGQQASDHSQLRMRLDFKKILGLWRK